MKLNRITFLFLLLFLFVPSVALAQSAANKSWQPFWTKFSAAVTKKNRVALKGMISNQFECGGGFCSPNEWIQTIDKSKKWQRTQRSIKSGAKSNGKNRRITNDDYLYFEFENGRWLWVGVPEEGA